MSEKTNTVSISIYMHMSKGTYTVNVEKYTAVFTYGFFSFKKCAHTTVSVLKYFSTKILFFMNKFVLLNL